MSHLNSNGRKRSFRIDRRQFLLSASGALLGLAVAPACRRGAVPPVVDPGAPGGTQFPLLEVSGSPYEIGRAIGERFGRNVRTGLERRREWFEGLRVFMQDDPASRYEPFLAAGEQHFPDVIEEMRGWADGSGIPFEDLLTLNLKAELATLRRAAQEETPGCSTLVLSHGERRIIAHNEDGHRAYRDQMFLVRATPAGKPSFLCLTYPGILCGNGPAINEAGIILTTNYIGGLDVRRGVPRYVLSRAVLGATSLDEAVEIVTHPERAFSFHYNLGSREEEKILSVETSVKDHVVWEVEGLYAHTNHLVLPGMEQTPQDEEYVSTSSMSRYAVLSAEAERLRVRLDEVGGEELSKVLALHDSAPYSPCRHPTDEVSGATLGHARFDLDEPGVRLSFSNTCRGMVGEFNV